MILTAPDAELFYKLLWNLHFYVNAQRSIHQNIASVTDLADLPLEKKAKVREALWKQPELIEAYVQENPDALTADELQLLRRWRTHFVKGTCYVFRHLKKGSIFIGNKDQVYSVIGLMTELDEVIPSYALPYMVDAVLLPFKGNIVYDSILPGYNVHFGGGVRSRLNHTYTVAKEKGRIITTLEPDFAPPSPAPKPATDALLPKLEELVNAASALKGDTNLQKAGLALARASLDLTVAAAKGEDLESHERSLRKTATRLFKLLDIAREY